MIVFQVDTVAPLFLRTTLKVRLETRIIGSIMNLAGELAIHTETYTRNSAAGRVMRGLVYLATEHTTNRAWKVGLEAASGVEQTVYL